MDERGKIDSVERSLSQGRAAAGLDSARDADETVAANIAMARRSYELWNSGGVEASLRDVWAPDIVFHEIPEAADTGVFQGAEAVAGHVRELLELGGHFQIELRSIEGCGSYVLAAVEQSFQGRTGGVAMAGRTFHLARWEGSRVCELHSFIDADQARREYERLVAAGD